MTLDVRKKLASESWEEKLCKVGMLNDLVKRAPKLGKPRLNSNPQPSAPQNPCSPQQVEMPQETL
jgi:hypothetical protein